MEKSEIQRILTAPICVLQRATEEERVLFADKKEGAFYKFGLASGQRFVGWVPKKENAYVFRPLRNLLPNLLEFKWEKTKSISDLGYTTTCRVQEGTESEKAFYEEALSPRKIPSPFLTKIAFQHYAYPQMLQRCIWLQDLNQRHEETQKTLMKIQKEKADLLIPENKNTTIQQKLKERRQNG